MARLMEETDLLIHPVSSRGDQASLPTPISESQGALSPLKQLSCLPCNICVKSKAAMLILVWSMIIGAVYLVLLNSFGVIGYSIQYYSEYIKKVQTSVNITIILAYSTLALILLVYPLSGYFADVWCGHYKAVTISLVLLCVALLPLCGATVIGMTKSWNF